jgi:hypothetical protein
MKSNRNQTEKPNGNKSSISKVIKNMKDNKIETNKKNDPRVVALHYMTTLVDVACEVFLILDAKLRVIVANPIFYNVFKTTPEQTEGKFFYELGNGQWDIPAFKILLEEILPKKKVIRNYEVKHVFETIGGRTIMLNARQIDSVQLIILALEDITARKELEEKLADYTKGLEIKVGERTKELIERIKELESLNQTMVDRELKMVELKKEIERMNKRAKNGNGKSGGKGKNGNSNKN